MKYLPGKEVHDPWALHLHAALQDLGIADTSQRFRPSFVRLRKEGSVGTITYFRIPRMNKFLF